MRNAEPSVGKGQTDMVENSESIERIVVGSHFYRGPLRCAMSNTEGFPKSRLLLQFKKKKKNFCRGSNWASVTVRRLHRATVYKRALSALAESGGHARMVFSEA